MLIRTVQGTDLREEISHDDVQVRSQPKCQGELGKASVHSRGMAKSRILFAKIPTVRALIAQCAAEKGIAGMKLFPICDSEQKSKQRR